MSTNLATIKFCLLQFLFILLTIPWTFVKIFIPKRRKNISGQLALITGGSEGIGRAIACRLAQEGCNIAIANRNLEKGQKTAEEIYQKYKVDVKAFQCDVSKREDVKRLKNEVKNSLGTVDLLVNNAGLMPVENSVLEGDDEYYQYCMDVNLTSYVWTTRAFLPDMIKQCRGHIVGISSITTLFPFHNITTYLTTKYGNYGFLEGLREDMCFFGYDKFIKISTAFPGFVRTNEEIFNSITEYSIKGVPLFGDPENIADLIVDGILKNCENIHPLRIEAFMSFLTNLIPRNLKTFLLKQSIKKDRLDGYIRKRLEKIKKD